MIEQIINAINDAIDLPVGSVKMAVAESVFKGEEYSPWLVDKNGDGKYAGFDNSLPASAYHKVNSIISIIGRNGVGDSPGDLINTYACTLVVYLNRKKTNLIPDDLFLAIQNQMPSNVKVVPYKNIVIRVQNVILNSMQVWLAEYQNVKFSLPSDSNLFAINYQVESTFKKGCFVTC